MSQSSGMTGPRLAALYQQLKESDKNGSVQKPKSTSTTLVNGAPRNESSKAIK